MAQQLRRIDPFSAAKVAAVLYGLMGLVFLPFVLLVGSLAPTGEGFPGMGFGLGFGIAIPIIYAACGFVFTLLGAALYNVVAGWVGGIEIELG